jgi:uncharacterized protein (TIGR00255 family)
MTGYGRGEMEENGFKVVVEVKSVNHRYNDIIIKLPRKLGPFEESVKASVKGKVLRGRVEVFVNVDEVKSDDYRVTPNFNVLDQYYRAYGDIAERYGISDSVTVSMLTRNSDSLVVEYKELDDETVERVLGGALELALESLTGMRRSEGDKLVVDIIERVEVMKGYLDRIGEYTPQMVSLYKQKLEERIKGLLEEVEIDMQKLAQEVAYFADRTNVAEEIVRLGSHFEQLADIVRTGGPVGRKLDFLVQEMNREVNTIGSKSPDFDMSNIVIDMKSELEKIREQIQNIE